MKKLIFLAAMSLAIKGTSGHPGQNFSELNLKLFDNGWFSVVLDNTTTGFPSNKVSLANLKPGNHLLKVIKLYPAFGSCTPNQIVFNGWIKIPAGSKVFAIINLYNQFEVFSILRKGIPHGYNSEPDRDCFNLNENFFQDDPNCMNQQNFLQLKNSMQNASFDSDKLIIAKKGISIHGISSEQVLELMETFSFEANKIKLAKYAYHHTFDRENYFVVNNGFTFSSSITELNNFISVN